MLDKAISITAKAFEGKFDKGGTPYILHCLHVMRGVARLGEEVMCIAVMHDLVEDTDWTLDKLLDLGFSLRIIDGISAMTHEKSESYDMYIRRIALNKDAREVKKEDLKHNSDITRIKGLREKDFKRLEKYQRAYVYLSD